MTTDISRTARQIINTYELRPETEENFRQMKDFKSTKYNLTLVGYLFSGYTRT